MAVIFGRRRLIFHVLVVCVIVTLIITFLLGLFPIPSVVDNCDCTRNDNHSKVTLNGGLGKVMKKRLAILVPFRDRFEELLEFAPHTHKFLNAQNIPHEFYIINQVDKYRFNRASLINVGFLESRKTNDYIAMHDVDLLPLNPELSYAYPDHGPFHLAAPELHPRYHYKNFVGGILLLTNTHFEMLNGMSNKYWGWGMEDDEFYARIKKQGLNLTRPIGIKTGPRDTFLHIHDRQKRKRDQGKTLNQKEENRRLTMGSGLSSINYKISSRYKILIDDTPVNVLNVNLHCDLNLTPWCEFMTSERTVKKKI